MKYAKYDQKTIYLVSKSKNPDLFPDLKIPRSTAKYWIRSKQYLKLKIQKESKSPHSHALKNEIKSIKSEKRILNNKLRTIISCLSILNKHNLIKTPSDPKIRFQIIQTIRNNRGKNSIRSILKVLQISFSTYKRWGKVEPISHFQEQYIQKTSRSLTELEVLILHTLYMDKSLFFYPLHALSTTAKKQQLVYASPRTWQKHIKSLGLQRPVLRKKLKKEYPIGIRAKYPHEIWHIDITEFKIKKRKVYLQAVIDNYSRSILSSKTSNSISGANTTDLIRNAVLRYGHPNKVMSDAGKENINHEVHSLLNNLNIKHVVAKVNTRFSNSIIEVFFRTMKSNYLNHLITKDENELSQRIEFYIEHYNFEIPHSALNFRTPNEVLNGVRHEYYPSIFKTFQKATLKRRLREYNQK